MIWLALALVVLGLWFLAARTWADWTLKRDPTLSGVAYRTRLGWKCKQCGQTYPQTCRCTGPLYWIKGETRIQCARCYHYHLTNHWLFRELPRPRKMRCPRCRWTGVITNWKLTAVEPEVQPTDSA